jgi:hypothetical protein
MNSKHFIDERKTSICQQGEKKISPDNFTIKMSIFEFTES